MKKLLFAFLLALVIHSTSYASDFSKYRGSGLQMMQKRL